MKVDLIAQTRDSSLKGLITQVFS